MVAICQPTTSGSYPHFLKIPPIKKNTLRLSATSQGDGFGGPSNAVGLRLYYDGVGRPSRFGMEVAPDPMKDYFLHSDSSSDFLNSLSPTDTDPKYRDSASVDRTTYKEIGTWRLTVQ